MLRLRDLGIWFLLVVLGKLIVLVLLTVSTTTTSAFSVKPRRNSFLKSRRSGSIFKHTATIRKNICAGAVRDPTQQPTNGDLAIEEIGAAATTDDALDDTNEADADADVALYCVLNLEDISVPFLSRADSESTFIDFSKDGAVCIPAGPVGQFKESLANFLAQSIIEVIIALSVLMSSLLVALSTVDDLEPFLPLFRTMENWIGLVLALEFAGRWISSSKDTGFFIFNLQFALDVVVVVFPLLFGLTPASFWEAQQQHASTTFPSWLTVPSWLMTPGGLFNLELLRVLRLRRVLRDLPTFEKFEKTLGIPNIGVVLEWQLQLARVLLSLFTLVSVATGLIYTTEHEVNPAISNYFDALYFGLTTLTTVGFGGKYRNTPTTFYIYVCCCCCCCCCCFGLVCAHMEESITLFRVYCANLTPKTFLRVFYFSLLCIYCIIDITPVTSGGKIVVCGSILVGVAVIPIQAAALVEALLARQDAGTKGGTLAQTRFRRTRNTDPSSSSTDDDIPSGTGRMMLETAMSCPKCGAAFHWSTARYCYFCGEGLD
jgi:hypothetical protein